MTLILFSSSCGWEQFDLHTSKYAVQLYLLFITGGGDLTVQLTLESDVVQHAPHSIFFPAGLHAKAVSTSPWAAHCHVQHADAVQHA